MSIPTRKSELKQDLMMIKLFQDNTTDHKARVALSKLAYKLRIEIQKMGANHG